MRISSKHPHPVPGGQSRQPRMRAPEMASRVRGKHRGSMVVIDRAGMTALRAVHHTCIAGQARRALCGQDERRPGCRASSTALSPGANRGGAPRTHYLAKLTLRQRPVYPPYSITQGKQRCQDRCSANKHSTHCWSACRWSANYCMPTWPKWCSGSGLYAPHTACRRERKLSRKMERQQAQHPPGQSGPPAAAGSSHPE